MPKVNYLSFGYSFAAKVAYICVRKSIKVSFFAHLLACGKAATLVNAMYFLFAFG